MAWNELDLRQRRWSIPRDRTKNGLPHEVPLSEIAVDIFCDQPRRGGKPLALGEAEGPFQGWSKAKVALDRRIWKDQATLSAWRLHDLRRTAATRMADMGTLPHVIEATLTISPATRLESQVYTTEQLMCLKSGKR